MKEILKNVLMWVFAILFMLFMLIIFGAGE